MFVCYVGEEGQGVPLQLGLFQLVQLDSALVARAL